MSERTVRRAVDEIKEVTGLDARRPRDRWQLDTARYALRVFGES